MIPNLWLPCLVRNQPTEVGEYKFEITEDDKIRIKKKNGFER